MSWSGGSATARSGTSSVTPTRPRRSPPPTSRSSDDGSPAPLTALSEKERERALDRFRLLRPHLEDGVPLTRLAETDGIALRTAQRWVQRYRAQGLAGLARRPRADRGATAFPPELIGLIEGLALQRPPPTAAAIHRRLDRGHRTWLADAQLCHRRRHRPPPRSRPRLPLPRGREALSGAIRSSPPSRSGQA